MGAERRKNYVMSVELAMQREMAYRQKLESFKPSCSTSSQKDPQVPTATSSQAPTTVQGSTPYPFPGTTPWLFPNPRPTPNVGPGPGQALPTWPNTWFRGPVPGPMPLVRPPFPGPQSGPSPTDSADQERRDPPPFRNFFCNVCGVDCTTSFNLLKHLQGRKHKTNLQKPIGKKPKVVGPVDPKQRRYCRLCGVWCLNEFAFRQHLYGKSHIAKLQDSEKKLMSPDGASGSAIPRT